ncbi:MAG: aldo/keto reductase [Flavipsychrobacter sp.]|nr:aldo/keto reductase [Flavipsychrobacter sp.]
MKYKLFGAKTGLYASELVFGSAMLGNRSGYGTTPEDAQSMLQRFTEAGGNFIDTSDRYQLGEAEELIGKFIASRRDDFIICTKYTRTSQEKPAIGNIGNHRKAMVQAVEASLKRLQTDHIDIYMPHYDDGVTPLEETVRGLDDLVRSGKVIYAGLANFPAWKAAIVTTLAAEQQLNIAAIQFEYSLLQRTSDREIVPMAQHLGMGAMMYSPLAGGLLTGKYRKGEVGRMNLTGKTGNKDTATELLLDVLQNIADEMQVLSGHVALAWAMAKGGFPIIGARSLAQLEDNLTALNVTLTEDHIKTLDELSAVSLGYPHELLAAQKSN